MKWHFAGVGVLALLLTLAAIPVGFMTDDQAFRAVLHARRSEPRAAWDLFRFSAGDASTNAALVGSGRLPWWTAPDFKLHFLRPATSALFTLDDAVFHDGPLGYHLHSIAWYLALLAALAWLYRRLFPGWTGVLALLVFALSHAHVSPYAWISARHVLVGGLPAVLALAAHVRSREDGWRPGRWLAPAGLVLGLSGSEAALAAVPFWLAYERASPARAHGWRDRIGRSVPPLAIAAAYLGVYHLIGCGARGSGGYRDPFSSPLAFAQAAATRVPILLGDALLGVRAEIAYVWGEVPLGLVGAAACIVLGALYAATRSAITEQERAALRWLVPGAVAATLVGVAGFPAGRVLVIPDVGFAALVGVLMRRGFASAAAAAPARGVRVAGAALLAIVHVGLAPLSSLHVMKTMVHRARATDAIARAIARDTPETGRVFLVAASDPMVFLYPRGILAETAPGRLRCFSVLSAARSAHRLTRTGERSLTLEPLDRPLLDGGFDTLFRSPDEPFAAGDVVSQCGAVVRVAAVEDGKPSRLDVTFDAPLDGSDLALLAWRGSRIERLAAPPVGAGLELPWSPGPSGIL